MSKDFIKTPTQKEEVDITVPGNWFQQATILLNTLANRMQGKLSADPSDPQVNDMVQWVSDGTDTGDDGDVYIKITDSNGTTKTKQREDFSVL